MKSVVLVNTSADLMTENQAFGAVNVGLVSKMLKSFALVPFTKVRGMSEARCMQLVRAARLELSTPNAKIYNRL